MQNNKEKLFFRNTFLYILLAVKALSYVILIENVLNPVSSSNGIGAGLANIYFYMPLYYSMFVLNVILFFYKKYRVLSLVSSLVLILAYDSFL